MKTVTRRPANHGLHLFLSLITFGLWLPVWAVVALIGRRERVWTEDDEQFQGPYSYQAPWPPPLQSTAPNPPSWREGDPHTMLYAGSWYRWNPWTNRWDRTYV